MPGKFDQTYGLPLDKSFLDTDERSDLEWEGEKNLMFPVTKARNRYDIRDMAATMPETNEIGEVLDDQIGKEIW